MKDREKEFLTVKAEVEYPPHHSRIEVGNGPPLKYEVDTRRDSRGFIHITCGTKYLLEVWISTAKQTPSTITLVCFGAFSEWPELTITRKRQGLPALGTRFTEYAGESLELPLKVSMRPGEILLHWDTLGDCEALERNQALFLVREGTLCGILLTHLTVDQCNVFATKAPSEQKPETGTGSPYVSHALPYLELQGEALRRLAVSRIYREPAQSSGAQIPNDGSPYLFYWGAHTTDDYGFAVSLGDGATRELALTANFKDRDICGICIRQLDALSQWPELTITKSSDGQPGLKHGNPSSEELLLEQDFQVAAKRNELIIYWDNLEECEALNFEGATFLMRDKVLRGVWFRNLSSEITDHFMETLPQRTRIYAFRPRTP